MSTCLPNSLITFIYDMLNLVVALPAEAKPLVDHWTLSRQDSCTVYPLYAAAGIRLIVCGPGKHAAVLATAFLAGVASTPENELWLNVGIAGSAGYPVGTPVLANKVVDDVSGEIFYPTHAFHRICASSSVVTVPEVENNYGGSNVYDMEASGFLMAATRFAPSEQIQVFKVISDGPEAPPEHLAKDAVSALVKGTLAPLQTLCEELGAVQLAANPRHSHSHQWDCFRNRWHFTTSQQHQLHRVLTALETFDAYWDPCDDCLEQLKTAKEVLIFLEAQRKRFIMRLA